MCGVDTQDYESLKREFVKTYQTSTQLSLKVAAAELLAVNIIPVNDATARNHARVFEAIKNFLDLYYNRPKFDEAADTRPTKTVLADAL